MSVRWPDVVDTRQATPVLCPSCLCATYYAHNTHRYCCPAHGPVTPAERTARTDPGRAC